MKETEMIREELKRIGNENKAQKIKDYLKSPYQFYGVSVPDLRKIARDYSNLDFYSTLDLFEELWNSNNHEEMSLALYLIEKNFKKDQITSWNFLIKKINRIKTWDHSDELSGILGKILRENLSLMREIKMMSEDKNPWIRRISIVSTLFLIKANKIELTLKLAEKLIYDEDIYVQKGAGWMLREAGKKNRLTIRNFILNHLDMKSYVFSYATEKMTELREIKKRYIKEQKEKIKGELI